MITKYRFYRFFPIHPRLEKEVEYCGVVERLPDGDITVLELFIDGEIAHPYPTEGKYNQEWYNLHSDIEEAVIQCDTPEQQARIAIPASSAYFGGEKPKANASQKPAPASNAHEVPLMVGITEQHGEAFTHTYEVFNPNSNK
jgi:hypothetical protein